MDLGRLLATLPQRGMPPVRNTAKARWRRRNGQRRQLTRLCLNHLGAVVGGLLCMNARKPAAEKAIRGLSIYLEGQRERVGYIELRRRGFPRGSGGIESANKFICHVRLKRSGAWWLEVKGNAMLHIRCALYNGTFEQIFADYMASRHTPTK